MLTNNDYGGREYKSSLPYTDPSALRGSDALQKLLKHYQKRRCTAESYTEVQKKYDCSCFRFSFVFTLFEFGNGLSFLYSCREAPNKLY